ncbi:MAG: lytic transglycosylase domain-containing protein [Oscillospiraceae bacterium]|nr:lytic transglycosylase domain-containing protein [Ruminococcus sp.]MCD8345696.1 lytic transglycosylase domain-containing protein [Oscillospiraceae bacterium]
MNVIKRIGAFILLILFVCFLGAFLFGYMPYWFGQESYRTDYQEIVEKYSEEFGIDEAFVFAVIKTESNFDPSAVSDAGAIGLMQIMEDSFDWVSSKLSESELTYEDMFTPEYSIMYGSYMLSFLYERYGSYELAAAAYHSGIGEVDSWIEEGTVSLENPDIADFEGSNTRHYVRKIMKAYSRYSEIL